MINTDIIKALSPCKERVNNYLKHYKEFSGSVREFSELTEITYSDKVWVLKRIATKEQREQWGARCAQSVLHIFEKAYPDDKRPRAAVEALLAGTCTKGLKRGANAAYNAAAYAANADAAYAAYATAAAAANAAYYAANAAAYAAAANAADAGPIGLKQQRLNLRMLVSIMEGNL